MKTLELTDEEFAMLSGLVTSRENGISWALVEVATSLKSKVREAAKPVPPPEE